MVEEEGGEEWGEGSLYSSGEKAAERLKCVWGGGGGGREEGG